MKHLTILIAAALLAGCLPHVPVLNPKPTDRNDLFDYMKQPMAGPDGPRQSSGGGCCSEVGRMMPQARHYDGRRVR